MNSQRFVQFETEITKRVSLNYLLYRPPGYDGIKRFPLIYFLHGKNERGTDPEILKRFGIPKLVETKPDLPFIAVSPQCPADSDWSAQMDALIALLDDVMANEAVDPTRVYLTGLSMGGRGAWQLAVLQPHRFAALVPICGPRPDILRREESVRILVHLPIWIFHGALDSVVPVAESIKLADELKALGGNVRLTIYPDAKHDSWTRTYENPELYAWLLEHSKGTL
jgi:predicted peptidase